MKISLVRFLAGQGLLALVVFVLLLIEREGDSWSGNDPINKAILIPFVFAGNFTIFALSLRLFRTRIQANGVFSTFVGGVISGTSLAVLPRVTAGFFSGWEVYAALGLCFFGIAFAWQGATRSRAGRSG